MSTNKSQKPFFKEWLEKLQQESWQLELLISGGAIYAILETIQYIEKFWPLLDNILDNEGGSISFSLLFGFLLLNAGIYIFLFNLILHVLVRSLWIGAIGQDSILHNIDLDEKEAFRQKTIKIRNILKSSISISVDEKKVHPNSISCDFYLHPDTKVKGLLCFFPLDSLTTGRHYFKIGKVKGIKKGNSSKEIFIDTTYHHIPFIYTGNR